MLKKELRGLIVHCPNLQDGCMWTGKMKKLANHLNPEVADSCPYLEVQCPSCAKPVRQDELALHAAQNCPQRAYECPHCGKYRSTFQDVLTNHKPVCKYTPTPCPNGCRETPMTLDLQNHVENDCLLTEVACDFKFFGCKATPLRNELKQHVKSSVEAHTKLLASTLEELVRQNTLFQLEMRKEVREVREENARLRHRVEEMAASQQRQLIRQQEIRTEKNPSSHSPIVIIQQTSQVRWGPL